jgi:hypothetical protein
VIKIRYADLPQGLHAQVRTCGRQPVIYLLPGLSPAQRRNALRRLIRTSRQGYGPRLRAAGVESAVARDVAKSTVRNGLAAVRCHPAGSVILAVLVTATVICYALFVTVTVRFSPHLAGPPAAAGRAPRPRHAGEPGPSPGGGPTAPAGTRPVVTVKRDTSPSAAGARSSASRSGSSGSGSSGSGSSGSGSGSPGPGTSPDPLPSGTWSAPGGVLSSASGGPPEGGSSPPSPPASGASSGPPSGAGHPGGLCLQLGPLGVCVSG